MASTADMPTTNQGPEDKTFADKIPQTVAEGFHIAADKAASAVTGEIKKTMSGAMNA